MNIGIFIILVILLLVILILGFISLFMFILEFFWPILLIPIILYLIPKGFFLDIKNTLQNLYSKHFKPKKTQYKPGENTNSPRDAEIIE